MPIKRTKAVPPSLRGAACSVAEIDVLRLAAQGVSVIDSAHALGCRYPSRVTYRRNTAMGKLGATNIVHAVALAMAAGLLLPSEIKPVE